ncbi:MAG: DNA polymerase I, partial [Muribaculaceae bacterium]|nr:DNA polymerase I [Muribaculaceae bacterium]
MNENRLFLLDAFALIFRAYYALIKMPRLTQGGFNTSAIFGFVNTLEEVIRKEEPTHLAVCFDPQGPTFRSEADASYKAEREAMPEDIRLSIPIIKEIIKAYNIPILQVEGFEADDVIGTMAKRAEKEGFTTYMMTPDKDFGQLVSPNVLQYKPSYRGQDFELRGEEEVCARYGLNRTTQVIDLLALMGDKVDNIPGCPGVGEKTAVKLIQDFGSVEELLANTDKLKGALKKKIEENAQQIRDSYFLATIRTDVPIDTDPKDLVRKPEDREKLFSIFKELEFKSLRDRVARRLDEAKAPQPQVPGAFPTSLFDMDGGLDGGEIPEMQTAADRPMTWKLVVSKEEADALADKSLKAAQCGLCFVADGENDMTAPIKGAALAVSDTEAY